jgi:hypothetical protein
MAKELTELTEVTTLPDDAKLYAVDSTRAIADQSVQIAKKNLITGGSYITKTSELTNDGDDGVNPFISALDVIVPTLQSAIDGGNTYVDGFNTWTWNEDGLTLLNPDDNFGFSIGGEEFSFKNGVGSGVGKSSLEPLQILIGNGTYASSIRSTNITTFRSLEAPDADGTIALKSDQEANTINSEPIGDEAQVLQVVSMTQAQYDLITPVATTFYIING